MGGKHAKRKLAIIVEYDDTSTNPATVYKKTYTYPFTRDDSKIRKGLISQAKQSLIIDKNLVAIDPNISEANIELIKTRIIDD